MTESLAWRVGRGSCSRWRSALFFLFPLLAMARLQHPQLLGGGPHLAAWANLVQDDALRSAIITSLLLAVLTVVLMLVLLVPTMIWVRLRVPAASKARRVPLPAAADDPAAGDRGRLCQRLRVGDLPARRLAR